MHPSQHHERGRHGVAACTRTYASKTDTSTRTHVVYNVVGDSTTYSTVWQQPALD